MLVQSDRFGTLDIADEDAIVFPNGLIGFPNDDRFVLLRPNADSRIAWLQSTKSPSLSLPVVSLHATAIDAPLDIIAETAKNLAIAESPEDCAVMLVVTVRAGERATVNLLAPLLVNAATRTGVQAMLDIDPRGLTTPLCLRPEPNDSETNDAGEANDAEAPMAATNGTSTTITIIHAAE